MTPLWNDPNEETNNPRRASERAAVREEIAGRLAERGVELSGDESDEQVVRVLDAIEEFEQARALLGGDSMVNEPQSSSPDDPALVVPTRRADEPVDQYLTRIRAATDRLR